MRHRHRVKDPAEVEVTEDYPRIDGDKRPITTRMSSFDSREVATFVTGTLPVFYGIQA